MRNLHWLLALLAVALASCQSTCDYKPSVIPPGQSTANVSCQPLANLGEVSVKLSGTQLRSQDNPGELFYVDTPSFLYRTAINSTVLTKRVIKAVTVPIGGGNQTSQLELAVQLLTVAGQQGVDVVLLPEEFAALDLPNGEAIDGLTFQTLSPLAKRWSMYVLYGMREKASDGLFNTGVLLDRGGNRIGTYRKMFPFWGEKVDTGYDGVHSFDVDFGRIAILTCFDANFPEVWQQAGALNAEVVFWPSAYGGGRPLTAYAILHHYYIVTAGWGNFIDSVTGQNLTTSSPHAKVNIAAIDLDKSLAHYNFNKAGVDALLKDHGNEVDVQMDDMAQWYILTSKVPNKVRVKDLMREYAIEELPHYQQRSRQAINSFRAQGVPVPPNPGGRALADDDPMRRLLPA